MSHVNPTRPGATSNPRAFGLLDPRRFQTRRQRIPGPAGPAAAPDGPALSELPIDGTKPVAYVRGEMRFAPYVDDDERRRILADLRNQPMRNFSFDERGIIYDPWHTFRPFKPTDPFQARIGEVPGKPEARGDAWRASLDGLIINAAAEFNLSRGLRPGDAEYLTPQRLKAQLMVESGGNREAFLTDPMQVNNSWDWTPDKFRMLGLPDPNERRLSLTPAQSIRLGLEWTAWRNSTHDGRGAVIRRGDARSALSNYNANNDLTRQAGGRRHRDWYADTILANERAMLTRRGPRPSSD